MTTVVIVEPYLPARVGLEKLLASEGFRVEAFATPEAAADLDGEIDVLLVDVGFPDPTGEALAVALRRARPRLRVVFMSAQPWVPARVPGPVLLKPIEAGRLFAAIG